MKILMNSLAVAAVLAWAGAANATIVNPAYLDAASSANAFNSALTTVDNSAMSVAVNSGDTLASAQAATHAFDGGFAQSYVSNAAAPDYFATGAPVTLVYDLGSDFPVSEMVLWQYQNNGGDGTSVGNDVLSMDVRINTEAQGTGAFAGPATSIAGIQSILGLGGTNSAQTFSLSGVGRYVELTLTDNHFGDPNLEGVTGGGDRVGFGEIRFNVPEPSTFALAGLAMAGFVALRRGRS